MTAKQTNSPYRISPAREASFAILQRIDEGKGHSDDLLHSMRVNALSAEDRNLTHALVMGTLRWQISLDAVVHPMLQHRDQQLQREIAIALRLGAFQLLHMDRIPAHAAIFESVELARANGAAHAAGMVNAILRRVSREIAALKARSTPVSAHPLWMLDRWNNLYGGKTVELLTAADQHEPTPRSFFPSTENETSMPLIDDGSRLVAELVALSHTAPKRILDCCAAPGGKTMVLALRHPDAEIVAADVNERRITGMKKRLGGKGEFGNIVAVHADMTQPTTVAELEGEFDLILCDAPCSGTGTLARNPEIRLRLQPEEFARQAERQRALLSASIARLAPGGRLLYSTCSLEPEENEDVVRQIMANQPKSIRQRSLAMALKQLSVNGLLAEEIGTVLEETALRGSALRTIPGTHSCDGFFAALIERLD